MSSIGLNPADPSEPASALPLKLFSVGDPEWSDQWLVIAPDQDDVRAQLKAHEYEPGEGLDWEIGEVPPNEPICLRETDSPIDPMPEGAKVTEASGQVPLEVEATASAWVKAYGRMILSHPDA